jgi:hypothetical protein
MPESAVDSPAAVSSAGRTVVWCDAAITAARLLAAGGYQQIAASQHTGGARVDMRCRVWGDDISPVLPGCGLVGVAGTRLSGRTASNGSAG